MPSKGLSEIIREKKKLFIIAAVCLFLIELEIFALAAMKSGRQSWLEISDHQGVVIYETKGDTLSDFNKYYFEKTFGPLDSYRVRMVHREKPFPFRAWFAAAVGIPVCAVLLLAFVVRAWSAIFYGDRASDESPGKNATDPGGQTEIPEGRLFRALDRVSRFNIFVIGFLVLTAALSIWMVPNLLADLSRAGIETLVRFKWVFLGAAAVVIGFLAWIIYLKYRLAQRAIDARTELDKYRLELEYNAAGDVSRQIEFSPEEDGEVVDVVPEPEEDTGQAP